MCLRHKQIQALRVANNPNPGLVKRSLNHFICIADWWPSALPQASKLFSTPALVWGRHTLACTSKVSTGKHHFCTTPQWCIGTFVTVICTFCHFNLVWCPAVYTWRIVQNCPPPLLPPQVCYVCTIYFNIKYTLISLMTHTHTHTRPPHTCIHTHSRSSERGLGGSFRCHHLVWSPPRFYPCSPSSTPPWCSCPTGSYGRRRCSAGGMWTHVMGEKMMKNMIKYGAHVVQND